MLPFPSLVVGHLQEPFRQCPRLAQFRKAREQFQASCLKNIGGICGGQSVLDRNRIDQRLVLIDQQGPSFFAPSQALRDKMPIIAGSRRGILGSGQNAGTCWKIIDWL
jgi:hypothetical protein